MGRKKRRLLVAWALCLSMLIGAVRADWIGIHVRAEGAPPPDGIGQITEGGLTYEWDGEVYVYRACGETFGNITVPAGCIFEVKGAVTAESISIQREGTLLILDLPEEEGGPATGTLTCPDINAQEAAFMLLANPANLPEGVRVFLGDTDVSGDPWSWMNFVYSEENGKWLIATRIEGPENGSEEDFLDYNWDGKVYVHRATGERRDYGSVYIPDDCIFEVTGDVNVTGTLTISENGRLVIMDSLEGDRGILTCADFHPLDGSHMSLGSNGNIPDGISVFDGKKDITAEEWGFTDFVCIEGHWYTENGQPGDDKPEDDKPGDEDPSVGPTAYAGAKKWIESWTLAYYGNEEEIKDYLTTELWNEGFCVFNGHNGDYTGMFETRAAFDSAVTLSDYRASGGILDLPSYAYSIVLNDVTAQGRVYVLPSAKHFGVKIGDAYYLADTSKADGSEDHDVYIQSSENPSTAQVSIFGNGVCQEGALATGSDGINAYHIGQGHSGLGSDYPISGIGCRLVIAPASSALTKITGKINAAAWDFAQVPLFTASGSYASPTVAEVYYGNDGSVGKELQLLKDSGVPSQQVVTKVSLNTSKISSDAATVQETGTAFELILHSNYDCIPLILTYADGSKGYLEIHRIGLHMNDGNVSSGSYRIFHGTDQWNDYTTKTADQKCVTASFYYNTGESKPTTDHVNLFVTVETDTGVTHKVVSCLNSDFIKASQGTDKYVDDFLLWSGSADEFSHLKSVSAIVYSAGDADSFGGIQIGSGMGVQWNNNQD